MWSHYYTGIVWPKIKIIVKMKTNKWRQHFIFVGTIAYGLRVESPCVSYLILSSKMKDGDWQMNTQNVYFKPHTGLVVFVTVIVLCVWEWENLCVCYRKRERTIVAYVCFYFGHSGIVLNVPLSQSDSKGNTSLTLFQTACVYKQGCGAMLFKKATERLNWEWCIYDASEKTSSSQKMDSFPILHL